jgi:hypothetical protein
MVLRRFRDAAMMTLVPKRRRFRFSLRTLFVVVTLAGGMAAFVGYNLNWIRQRHEFSAIDEPIWAFPKWDSIAPGMLWIFGEDGCDAMIVACSSIEDATEKRRGIRRLFPECEVNCWYESKPGDRVLSD